jgi:hypothetical protein
MTSTTNNAPASLVTRPIPSMSWTTPVEVSLCWASTPFTGASARALATSSGGTSRPHSYSILWTSSPKASAILAKRSPKYPATGTITRSPGENRFATDDSSPPVPDAVKIRMSPSVLSMARRPAVTSLRSWPYPGPR